MVEDIILANSDRKELGAIQDSNITVDVNGEYEFSVQIARSNWYADLDLASYVYITGTEYGGIVGEVLTDTTLDYVELKGLTWRGRLQYKVIEPPSGSDYKTVSGELNQVMKTLIEPEFDGLFKVSTANTGVSVKNYQFDRYCTLLGGLTKMLKSVGHGILNVKWDPIEDATSYEVCITKEDGAEKVFTTIYNSLFVSDRFDDFVANGMDGATVKVKAYGDNDTFGCWSYDANIVIARFGY